MIMRYRDREISRIDLDSDHVLVDWNLHNHCNYSCAYCWGGAHDGSVPALKFNDTIANNISHLSDQLLSVPDNSGKMIKFMLTGGETTLFGDIVPISEYLSDLGHVSLMTNGSRTMRWWRDNWHLFGSVSISIHVCKHDPKHTIEVADFLCGKLPLQLHVMMDPGAFEQAIDTYMSLASRYTDRSVEILAKVIVPHEHYGKSLDDEQLASLAALPRIRMNLTPDFVELMRSSNRNLPGDSIPSMRFTDGSSLEMEPRTIGELTGSFLGYHCWAHHQLLYINAMGEVGRLQCGNRFCNHSNLHDPDFPSKFRLRSDPIRCETGKCGCVGLFFATKSMT